MRNNGPQLNIPERKRVQPVPTMVAPRQARKFVAAPVDLSTRNYDSVYQEPVVQKKKVSLGALSQPTERKTSDGGRRVYAQQPGGVMSRMLSYVLIFVMLTNPVFVAYASEDPLNPVIVEDAVVEESASEEVAEEIVEEVSQPEITPEIPEENTEQVADEVVFDDQGAAEDEVAGENPPEQADDEVVADDGATLESDVINGDVLDIEETTTSSDESTDEDTSLAEGGLGDVSESGDASESTSEDESVPDDNQEEGQMATTTGEDGNQDGPDNETASTTDDSETDSAEATATSTDDMATSTDGVATTTDDTATDDTGNTTDTGTTSSGGGGSTTGNGGSSSGSETGVVGDGGAAEEDTVGTTTDDGVATSTDETDTGEEEGAVEDGGGDAGTGTNESAGEVEGDVATTSDTESISEPVPQEGEYTEAVNTVFNAQNRYMFGEQECTLVADGEFYCISSDGQKDAQTEAIAAGVYVRKDIDGDKEIYFKDASGERKITNNTHDDDVPFYDEHWGRIVWQSLVNDRWQIMVHDLLTGHTRQITDTKGNNTNPHMDGDIVVWQGWDNGDWEVFYTADIYAGQSSVIKVTENEEHDMFPQANGYLITWQGATGEGWRVYVHDIYTQKTTEVAKNTGGKYENPRFVLLIENRKDNGDVETLGYDIASGETIELGTSTQIPMPADIPEAPTQEQGQAVPTTATSTQLKTTSKDTGDGGDDGGGG